MIHSLAVRAHLYHITGDTAAACLHGEGCCAESLAAAESKKDAEEIQQSRRPEGGQPASALCRLQKARSILDFYGIMIS